MPATTSRRLPADALSQGQYDYTVTPGTGRYIRLQVLDRDGAIIAESNPLWILREPPPHGIPAARRLNPMDR